MTRVNTPALWQLREARGLSQEELGARVGNHQSHVSKLERSTDIRINTLQRYVEAVGGELEIAVRLSNGKSGTKRIILGQFTAPEPADENPFVEAFQASGRRR